MHMQENQADKVIIDATEVVTVTGRKTIGSVYPRIADDNGIFILDTLFRSPSV